MLFRSNRYVYTDLNGELHKYFRKEWNRNENGIMDLVMSEFIEKTRLQDINSDQQDTTGE